jgi:hypothetical protein
MRSAGLAVVGATGLSALSGCDLDLGSPTPAATPTPDADERLLTAARAELTTLIARLSVSRGPVSQSGLEQVHRVQLAALGGRPRTGAPRARPLHGAQLVARERVAAARFTAWARAAHSGDLARVLAAVAAGIRMQPVLQGAR